LRAVGGWDAHNLTEDADLGMRLARFGYGSAVIASTTYEEAPARFSAWLKQRRRWFQGWMRLVKGSSFCFCLSNLGAVWTNYRHGSQRCRNNQPDRMAFSNRV
jgi:cellulose synthase/poly-beta-1,6-N-acetylglucosamine synthase-like glycosyltransferase